MQNVELKDALHGVRPGGCVRPLSGRLCRRVSSRQALPCLSAVDYVRSAAHLGRWMDVRAYRRGSTQRGPSFGVCPAPLPMPHGGPAPSAAVPALRGAGPEVAEYLGRWGVIPPLAGPPPKAVPTPLLEFRTWMICHRGVTQRTVERYERLIARMLPALGNTPAVYDAALVRQVLLEEIRPLSCADAKMFVTALRAFPAVSCGGGTCP